MTHEQRHDEIQRLYGEMIQTWVDASKYSRDGNLRLSKSGERRMTRLRQDMLKIEKGLQT